MSNQATTALVRATTGGTRRRALTWLAAVGLSIALAVPARAVAAPQERRADPHALEQAAKLEREVERLYDAGDYAAAAPIADKLVALQERLRGPEHADVALALMEAGRLYRKKGDAAKAEPLLLRALAIREKVLGAGHADVGRTLDELGKLYEDLGAYEKANAQLSRALTILEKELGATHEEVATTLADLAVLHTDTGDFERAEELFRRAIELLERRLGPDDAEVGHVLNNFGRVVERRGDLTRAEALYRRALAIFEKKRGSDNPDVAAVSNNLAALYAQLGDTARAEPLYERALAIQKHLLGPGSPDVATTLNNLGSLQEQREEYDRAQASYEEALQIAEKAYGPDNDGVAPMLNNLAGLLDGRGEIARAKTLYLRLIEIDRRALKPDHPYVALDLNNLGWAHYHAGEYAEAELLYRRALAIFEGALGPLHPHVARSLGNLSLLCDATGRTREAIELRERSVEIEEREIELIIATGSEKRKLAFMESLTRYTEATLSLHAASAPSDPRATRLALTTILRRKGRALDAMAGGVAAIRTRLDAEGRALLDRLASVRAKLATRVLEGPEPDETSDQQRAALAALEKEEDALEEAASARGAESGATARRVTPEAVSARIPKGAALVELVVYRPVQHHYRTEADRWGARRYAAYVLRHDGQPRWADLGEAAGIDAQVLALRRAIGSPHSTDVPALARALDERVMRPVRAQLGDATHVIVSPDGSLNLVPFPALVDETGRRLVERYTFSYVTSGRDLLRTRAPSREGAVVLAAPEFGSRAEDLPGTKDEARAVAAAFPGSRMWLGLSASESALKTVHGPKLLHIATHGFFADSMPGERWRAFELALAPGASGSVPPSVLPLLRSGLILSPDARAGGEDGVLTALETAGLDLHGTALVVLSACETGVGDVKAGDGVYGLRRALVLAGAETQVMSLWKVDDAATLELMTGYYAGLREGAGRAEAMRRVQLAMLGRPATAHPFYWASFIVSGDRTPLPGIGPSHPPDRVAPGSRGCACEMSAPDGGSAWALAAAAFLIARGRRARGSRRPENRQ